MRKAIITRTGLTSPAITASITTLRRAVTAALDIPAGGMPWHGGLTAIGIPTGDGRFLERLRVLPETLPSSLTIDHEGVRQAIGRIDTVEFREMPPRFLERLSDTQRKIMEMIGSEVTPMLVWGTGIIGDSPDGPVGPEQLALAREVAGMIEAGWLSGVSVELSDVTGEQIIDLTEMITEDDEGEVLRIPFGGDFITNYTDARLDGASVVVQPAFIEGRIQLGIEGETVEVIEEVEEVMASDRWAFTAALSGALPTRKLFEVPEGDQPWPVTVTETRRIFAHFAVWGECHRGSGPNECLLAPRSPSDYQEFMVGGQRTAEGVTMAVGRVTMGGLHADPNDPALLTLATRRAWYEDQTTGVARVAAYDGRLGPFYCGIIPDHVTDEQIDELLSCPPSGDWLHLAKYGALDCIAVHSVNTPGYVVPRARVASLGDCESCDVQALVVSVGHAAIVDLVAAPPDPYEALVERVARLERVARIHDLEGSAADILRSRI